MRLLPQLNTQRQNPTPAPVIHAKNLYNYAVLVYKPLPKKREKLPKHNNIKITKQNERKTSNTSPNKPQFAKKAQLN